MTWRALPPGWAAPPRSPRDLLSEDLLSPLRCCRPWSPAPAPAMDEITFRSDTVLSDVHLYTPNQRRLMVRLNGMGQPGKLPKPRSPLCFLRSHRKNGKDWLV